jgi:hypothetical protein
MIYRTRIIIKQRQALRALVLKCFRISQVSSADKPAVILEHFRRDWKPFQTDRESGSLSALFAHGQNGTESRLSGDHLVVSLSRSFKRVTLDHWTNAADCAEFQRVLRVFTCA